MDPVAIQGLAQFSWVWRGAVDSDVGGCCGIANEPSPDTVAILWDSPVTSADTRITFTEPVEAVFFNYTLDTDYGTPTVVFYDEAGVQIGSEVLDVCGAVGCGNTCTGDPTGELCHFEHFQFVALPSRGISYIEFEGASGIFGQFALDDLTYFTINPIFLDGFEIGTTEMWYSTVGLPPTPTPTATPALTPTPPPCSDIEVGSLTWLGTDRVRIEVVGNNNPLHTLVHTRTELDWTKVHPNQYFNYMRFDQIADIRTADDNTPPTEQDIDIPFNPGQSSQFTAGWAGWDHTTSPLSGDIEATFYFEFPSFGNTCTVVRSISQATPTPTPTPVVPLCSNIEVGDLYYLDNNRVRINVVRNNNPIYQLMHKRTVIEWEDLYDPSQYLNFIDFTENGGVYYPGDDYTPNTDVSVDVPFNPGQGTQFTTRWDGVPSYIAGTTTVTFYFEFPYNGLTCTETRTVFRAPPTPTPTPTPTATPVPANCSEISLSGMRNPGYGFFASDLVNNSNYTTEITSTTFTWEKGSSDWRIDWYKLGTTDNTVEDTYNYWGGNNGSNPTDPNTPSTQATTVQSRAQLAAGQSRIWVADIDGSGSDTTPLFGDHDVCLDILILGGAVGGGDMSCNVCDSYGLSTPTPTNTSTITITPTNTFTPTITSTITITATITPTFTQTPTNTPSPPTFTPTFTPTRTHTFTSTNTPTNTPTRTMTPTDEL